MSYPDSGNSNLGHSNSGDSSAWPGGGGVPPHAYDPDLQPELFRSVVTRRIFAFFIDVIVISIPVILVSIFIFLFGLVTFLLGWTLFLLVWPATVVWAAIYYGACIGGAYSATLGMRLMDLELRTWYGAPGYFVLGAMHGILFWFSVSLLSPLVILIGLFNGRRRLLHDYVLGTVVINTSVRSSIPQATRTTDETYKIRLFKFLTD